MTSMRLVPCICAFALGLTAAPRASASSTVSVFKDTSFPGSWGPGITTTATFPDAQTMQGFDTMRISMDMACPASGCGPWDYVASLYWCADANDTSSCTQEIARWVTAYGLPGHWTTDISPMLALVRGGGKQAFYFWTPQGYVLNVDIALSASDTGVVAPSRAIPIFSGGNLDSGYNAAHKPITVSFAQKPRKAKLFTLVTGHGWGTTAENCAEFCNIAHHIGVGGQDFTIDFPIAGTATGCQDLVNQGVVANQAGTWQYGRDGWCPGWDVHPWVVDVTDQLQDGNNTLTYVALFNGQPYSPTPVSSPPANAIGPSITMSSYLVVWDAPAQANNPNGVAANPAPSVPAPAPVPTAGASDVQGMDTHAGCAATDLGTLAFMFIGPACWLLRRRALQQRA